jgi:hypothetical protein
MIDSTTQRIARGQAAEPIDPTLNPETTAAFIVYAAQRMAADQVNTGDPAPSEPSLPANTATYMSAPATPAQRAPHRSTRSDTGCVAALGAVPAL